MRRYSYHALQKTKTINLHNANTETEQVKEQLEVLQSQLKNLDIGPNKRIIFTGDFNIFFNWKLVAKGGQPLLKRKSITKLVETNESLDIAMSGELENLTLEILHFDKTIPPDL